MYIYRKPYQTIYKNSGISVCSDTSPQCSNGGTCEETDDGFKCNCAPGWEGVFCNTSKMTEFNSYKASLPVWPPTFISLSASLPACLCIYLASCLAACLPDRLPVCLLACSYAATHKDVDNCLSRPCQNGGICEDGNGDNFDCDCSGSGFSGPTCELGAYLVRTKYWLLEAEWLPPPLPLPPD